VLEKGQIACVNKTVDDDSEVLLQFQDPQDKEDQKKWVRREDYGKLRLLSKQDAKKAKGKQVKGNA